MTTHPTMLIPINDLILEIRGTRVLLDADLAKLYGVRTAVLVQAVKRNPDRFPDDFMFQLTPKEHRVLRSQLVTSKPSGHGGRRYPPFAFTEQGVAMLSSVLRSPMAVLVNISIMRAFVQLRHCAMSHSELARRLDTLEKTFDQKFQIVFEAIEAMLEQDQAETRPVGFELDGE